MLNKKTTFCNFTSFLSIGLLLYIFVSFYFNNTNNSSDSIDFILKTSFLAFVFVVLTVLITSFKIYKNKYVENRIKQRTSQILTENEILRNNTHIDSLTQCINKKYFNERFEEEFKRAIREKQYISLIIVNIDEFKSFNDIYGKDEGDECLKVVANILVNHCSRPSDLVSRFNGDEFYILLPNTKDPKTVSNKCVDSVKSLNISHENSIASNVLTISIGVASILPLHPKQMDELTIMAKESLTQAKRSGRNRVF